MDSDDTTGAGAQDVGASPPPRLAWIRALTRALGSQQRRWSRRARVLSLTTALIILFGGIAISVGLAAFLRANAVSSANTRFANTASLTRGAITSTLRRYGDLMNGTASFIATNAKQDYATQRTSYLQYLALLQLSTNYPGTYGLGFIGRVPAADVPALNVVMRQAGQTGFVFTPSSVPYACPIEFFAWEGQEALPANYATMDFCSTNLITAPLEQAIAAGRQVVVPRASFLPGPSHAYDFAIITPVFFPGQPTQTAIDRAQSLMGWAVGLFQGPPLATSAVAPFKDIGIQLYSGYEPVAANLVVAQPSQVSRSRAGTYDFRINAYGPWFLRTINMASGTGIVGIVSPLTVLLGGTALSLALFGVIQVLRHAEARARRLADESTASMRASEQRFRSLAASSPAGILHVDTEGNCLYANRRMRDITGRPPESLKGLGWLQAIPVDDRTAVLADIQTMLKSGDDELSGDMRFLTPNGERHWTRLRAAALKAASGATLGWVVTVEDVTQLVRASKRLQQQALHDPLTGLANRSLFLDRLHNALARAKSRQQKLAVLFLDLDRFKLINDSLGHHEGDQLLIAVAKRIQGALRAGDTLARFGGDEFTVLAEHVTSVSHAARIAERVSSSLQEPFRIGPSETFVTASIGIVVVTDQPSDLESVLSDADTAMYLAKERGRARYEIFNADLREDAMSELELETALRRALERHELRVFYQPLVDVGTQELFGAEALVRWDHPDRGILGPDEFISLAEDTGLIVPIGRWVLDEAVRQFAWWRRSLPWGSQLQQLAVNLSTRQLSNVGLVAEVRDILAGAELEPSALTLEITESVIMSNSPQVLRTVSELKTLGLKLAVDDFGTGFSSLSQLKQLPVDILKVDRSFVDGLGEDGDDEAIVAAVVQLGHLLGLRIVAEGVETPTQLIVLQHHGAELAQGFLWSRPVPADEFVRWYESARGQDRLSQRGAVPTGSRLAPGGRLG